MKLTSKQISDYFTGRRAQEILPELIQRLVFAQGIQAQIKRCRFPVGEAIKEHGFDGYVKFKGKSTWVPAETSLWDVGTDETPKTKAEDDWNSSLKRNWPESVDRQKYTWIFVTPHSWPEQNRQPWVEEKNKKGIWKEVRVYDATDLEAWLVQSPSVTKWLNRIMGFSCPGMYDLEEFIDVFIPQYISKDDKSTRMAKSQLIIGGRNTETERLLKWMVSGGSTIMLLGESREEDALFSVATIFSSTSNHHRTSIISRMVFLETSESVRIAEQSDREIIIVPLKKEAENAALASRNQGFRVVRLGISRPISQVDTEINQLVLGKSHPEPIKCALNILGQSERISGQIAIDSKGSLKAVLWALNDTSELAVPPWAKSNDLDVYASLWLIGQWNENNKNDQELLEVLTDKKWNDIERIVLPNIASNGQFERFGKMVDWKAWHVCLNYVMPAFSEKLLERYKDCLMYALTEPDPKVDMKPEERWMSEVKGIRHPYSEHIRHGLISSLVKIGVSSGLPLNIRAFVPSVIRKLLFESTGKQLGVRWASLSTWLGEFAEASPDTFLEACQKFVNDHDACSVLFVKTDNTMFTSSYHSYLLWALERLAWNTEYLPLVVDLLAILVKKDFEIKILNTPLHTLNSIFLPWHPHTLANTATRKSIFLILADKYPDVAWRLACDISPSSHGTTSGTDKPKWHDWLEKGEPEVTNKEYFEYSEFILRWMIDKAKENPKRWTELIQSYDEWEDKCPPDVSKLFLSSLSSAAKEDIDVKVKELIYNSLRKLVVRHRDYSETEWAMGEEQLKPFDTLVDEFSPKDALSRNVWLFDPWPDIAPPRKMSFEERDKYLDELREKVIKDIHMQQGLDNIFETVAKDYNKAWQFGLNLAKIDLSQEEKERIYDFGIKPAVTGEKVQRTRLSFLQAYICKLIYNQSDKGQALIESVIKSHSAWDINERVNFAMALPVRSEIWEIVSSWGADARKRYWEEIQYNCIEEFQRDLTKAVEELLAVSRPCKAVDTIYMSYIRSSKGHKNLNISNELIIEAIRQAPLKGSDIERNYNVDMIDHAIDELLGILEVRGVKDEELASLEWPWMAALEHSERGIKSLKKCLSTQPSLLVDILKVIFRSENEKDNKELSEGEQQRAQMGFRLLRYWNSTPGTIYTDTQEERNKAERGNSAYIHFRPGSVKCDELWNYCVSAREMAEKCGRQGVCDSQIGNVLAHSPIGDDGAWPSENVCTIIERLNSDRLDQNIHMGVNNKRGAHFVAPDGSGDRRIAEQFKKYLESRRQYPRVSRILKGLIEDFERQAKQHQENERYREFRD